MSKKVVIIGLHYHPNMPSRVGMVCRYFCEKYDTTIITSDFVHPTKEYDRTEWDHCVKLHVPRYTKNFSVQRIISHLRFAQQINKQLKRLNPDLVYVCVPPNYSSLKAVKWANRNRIPCIIDIVDIWPNANAPSNAILGIAYKVWGAIRDNAIKSADRVILECGLYKEDIPQVKSTIIPLAKITGQIPQHDSHDELKIVYLGAFSTSYDFETLVFLAKFIKDSGRSIMVILIGKGDEKERVLSLLRENDIPTVDYGVIYDETEKSKILELCDFGYNGFAPGMAVGQSYKSLDYMCCGLALINSLKGDLETIIISEECGFNFDINSRDKLALALSAMSRDDIEQMKKKSYEAFLNNFSWDVYVKKMDEIIKEIPV